jgi:hypothetical protein
MGILRLPTSNTPLGGAPNAHGVYLAQNDDLGRESKGIWPSSGEWQACKADFRRLRLSGPSGSRVKNTSPKPPRSVFSLFAAGGRIVLRARVSEPLRIEFQRHMFPKALGSGLLGPMPTLHSGLRIGHAETPCYILTGLADNILVALLQVWRPPLDVVRVCS